MSESITAANGHRDWLLPGAELPTAGRPYVATVRDSSVLVTWEKAADLHPVCDDGSSKPPGVDPRSGPLTNHGGERRASVGQ